MRLFLGAFTGRFFWCNISRFRCSSCGSSLTRSGSKINSVHSWSNGSRTTNSQRSGTLSRNYLWCGAAHFVHLRLARFTTLLSVFQSRGRRSSWSSPSAIVDVQFIESWSRRSDRAVWCGTVVRWRCWRCGRTGRVAVTRTAESVAACGFLCGYWTWWDLFRWFFIDFGTWSRSLVSSTCTVVSVPSSSLCRCFCRSFGGAWTSRTHVGLESTWNRQN